ncbi:MAG: hypothetical protein JW751_20500 [Polyangiaceae bacterium]|nr:hypothetical protein [Polyangiaceae bacterium]
MDDLTELSDESLVARAVSEFGVLALWALRDGRRGAERILAGLRRLGWALQRLWAGPDGKRAMTLMVTHIYGVSQDLEPAELRETLEEVVPGAEELVMTVAREVVGTTLWGVKDRVLGGFEPRDPGRAPLRRGFATASGKRCSGAPIRFAALAH